MTERKDVPAESGLHREAFGTQPVQTLLEDVAAGTLAPGGISVAALSGAIAAALVRLIGSLTAGKAGYEPLTEEMERAVERCRVLQDQLLALMDQELEAFNQLVGSLSLPKGSPDEQAIRRDCIRIARRGYTQVPLQTGQLAMEVLALAESMVRYGNREAIADSGMAFLAAVAAVKGALLEVLINLQGQDDEWAEQAHEKVQKWQADLAEQESEIWAYLLQQIKPEA